MTIKEYLSNQQEEMPKWLKSFKKGDKVEFSNLSESRIIYYPGSGYDGLPLEEINKAHYAHVYIYVDYGLNRESVEQTLYSGEIVNYRLLELIEPTIEDLTPKKWKSHVTLNEKQLLEMNKFKKNAFGFLGIFERKSNNQNHGAQRFALLFLGADGIATYDALFGNNYLKIDTLILQDHEETTNNYDKFGRGGLMEAIAIKTRTFPELILCSENTDIWNGYTKLKEIDVVSNREHHQPTYLWKKK